MSQLSNLHYQIVENHHDFFINVGKIRYGWMDITIGTPTREYSYRASYICDPLTDLIDVVIFLMKDNWVSGKYIYFGKDDAFIGHELEGSSIDWYFKRSDDLVNILVWEDVDRDSLMDSLNYNVDDQWLLEPFDIGKGLLFSLQTTLLVFGRILLKTCDDVTLKMSEKKYLNDWGCAFPSEKVSELRDLVTD